MVIDRSKRIGLAVQLLKQPIKKVNREFYYKLQKEFRLVKKMHLNLLPEEIKRIVVTVNNRRWLKKCKWCGRQTFAIQRHHYPKSSKNGGNDIVKICGNCHASYHWIEKCCFQFEEEKNNE